MRVFGAFMLAAGLAVSIAAPARADDAILGEWLRDTGSSRVRFAPCGGAVCGVIVWLRDKDSEAKVGQRIFFGMKPTGANTWAGSAFNPEDGKTYSGKMTLSGNTLSTAGCVLGGLICKSASWTRAN
jgi:uncharacterized protein (DUF2147 family)